MTGLAKTMEILRMIMNSICSFLNLTMESEVDFGGVLPSLDLNLWIRKEDNRTLYAFYEKPMATNMMIQKKSAMPENMRMSSLNQEMYRRMTNTSELVTLEQRLEIVDQYGQKLTNSGYGLEQIRRAMVGGLVRYERRLLQSLSKPGVGWRPLHEGAKYNASNRRIKKMLAKSNWFKRKRDKGQDQGDGDGVEKEGSPSKRSRREDDEDSDLRGRDQMQEVKLTCDKTSSQRQSVGKHNQKHSENSNSQHKVKQDSQQAGSDQKSRPGRISTGQGKTSKPDPPTISVMFVDQTVGGVLAKMLQEVEDRLARITGYRVRITETSGSQLCRILPNTNPWGTKDCERGNCYTCSQSGEKMEDCKRRNILYESVCLVCNKEEVNKKYKSKWEEFKQMDGIYVGESARSLFERVGEHWQDVQSGNCESHMLKHWYDKHRGEEDTPKFRVKMVGSFGDALTRQISESVRIELRGENVLNSRAEYSRCRLPRLTMDKEEWRNAKKKEVQLLDKEDGVQGDTEEQDLIDAIVAGQDEVRRTKLKRKGSKEGGVSKKRRMDPLLDWGDGEGIVDVEMRRWLGLEDETGEDWREWHPRECLAKGKKMKQLELTFLKKHKEEKLGPGELIKAPGDGTENSEGIVVTDERINEEMSGVATLTGGENIEEKDNVKNNLVATVIKRKKVTLKNLAKSNMKITNWISKPGKKKDNQVNPGGSEGREVEMENCPG